MEELVFLLVLICLYVICLSSLVVLAIQSLGTDEYRREMSTERIRNRKNEKIIKLALNEANDVKRFEILKGFESSIKY